VFGIMATFFQWYWIILLSLTNVTDGANSMGWLMYLIFVSIVAKTRRDLRDKRNVYGNIIEDLFATMTMYPFTLAQMEHEAETGDKLD